MADTTSFTLNNSLVNVGATTYTSIANYTGAHNLIIKVADLVQVTKTYTMFSLVVSPPTPTVSNPPVAYFS